MDEQALGRGLDARTATAEFHAVSSAEAILEISPNHQWQKQRLKEQLSSNQEFPS
jgi:hypothetical protein